jgi:hypothetical protein
MSTESQYCDPNGPPVGRYQDQKIAVEEGQVPHGSVRKPGVVPTSSRRQIIGTLLAVQTPSGRKSSVGAVTRDHLRNAKPGSGNALATGPSTISRGKSLIFHPSFPL